MQIAILGATSQIAKDLILSFSATTNDVLHLFARQPDVVTQWLAGMGIKERYTASDYAVFADHEFDAVINFVGVGNPARTVEMGASIFDITHQYDDMAMDYVRHHAACRYIFLSSGAAYGAQFIEPVSTTTPALVPINTLSPQDWYGVAKLYAECRHRAQTALPIIDIRIFNYFSRSQDIAARFLITDMLRAIRDQTVLQTSADHITRDFLHPTDFYGLISALLSAKPANAVVDAYTRAPISKSNLLAAMQEQFGLQYEVTASTASVNATGGKPHYYSLNRHAADFGYQPSLTSLEGVMREAHIILSR
uniref:Putative dTDP-glucose 4,6-dehydratase n=1 Tax=mine drainage metagenome TaxID=410659 RepID=E6QRG1_9ZZZZ